MDFLSGLAIVLTNSIVLSFDDSYEPVFDALARSERTNRDVSSSGRNDGGKTACATETTSET